MGEFCESIQPSSGLYWGAYSPNAGERITGASIKGFEDLSTTNLDIELDFIKFNLIGANGSARVARLARLVQTAIKKDPQHRPRAIFLKLEPWSSNNKYDTSYSLEKFLKKKFDHKLVGLAKQLARLTRKTGIRFMVSFGHEMNKNWYPWGQKHAMTADRNSPFWKQAELYKDAYRHVHKVMSQHACLTWVWNVDAGYPAEPYYPGDDVVNWVGIDGYNWTGKSTVDGTFHGLQYLKTLQKPIMIAETACNRDSKSSAQCMTDLVDTAVKEKQVKALVYFNIKKKDKKMGREQIFTWAIPPKGKKAKALQAAVQKHQAAFGTNLVFGSDPKKPAQKPEYTVTPNPGFDQGDFSPWNHIIDNNDIMHRYALWAKDHDFAKKIIDEATGQRAGGGKTYVDRKECQQNAPEVCNNPNKEKLFFKNPGAKKLKFFPNLNSLPNNPYLKIEDEIQSDWLKEQQNITSSNASAAMAEQAPSKIAGLFKAKIMYWMYYKDSGMLEEGLKQLEKSLGAVKYINHYLVYKLALLIISEQPPIPREIKYLKTLFNTGKVKGFNLGLPKVPDKLDKASRYNFFKALLDSYTKHKHPAPTDPQLESEIMMQLVNLAPDEKTSDQHLTQVEEKLDSIFAQTKRKRSPQPEKNYNIYKIIFQRETRLLPLGVNTEYTYNQVRFYLAHARVMQAQCLLRRAARETNPIKAFNKVKEAFELVKYSVQFLDKLHFKAAKRIASECLIILGYYLDDYGDYFDVGKEIKQLLHTPWTWKLPEPADLPKGQKGLYNQRTYDTIMGWSYFYQDEFSQTGRYNLELLIKKINEQDYIGFVVSPTLAGLNKLLETPNLYDLGKSRWSPKINNNIEVQNLIKETQAYRNKPFNTLKIEQQKNIIRLNRLLLEITYPSLSPKGKPTIALFQTANMLLTGLPNESVISWANTFKRLKINKKMVIPTNWLRQVHLYAKLWAYSMEMSRMDEHRQGVPKEYLLNHKDRLEKIEEELLALLTPQEKAILMPDEIAAIKVVLVQCLARQGFIALDFNQLTDNPSNTRFKRSYQTLFTQARKYADQVVSTDENQNKKLPGKPAVKAEAALWLQNMMLVEAGKKDTKKQAEAHMREAIKYKELVLSIDYQQPPEYWLKGTSLSRAFQMRGELLAGLKKFKAAEYWLRRAINPREGYAKNFQAMAVLGDVLNWQGRHNDAIKMYARVPAYSPAYTRARLGQREAGMRLGEVYNRDSIKEFEKEAAIVFASEPPASPLITRTIRGLIEAYRTDEDLQGRVIAMGETLLGVTTNYKLDPKDKAKVSGLLKALTPAARAALEDKFIAELYLRTSEGLLWRKEFELALDFLADIDNTDKIKDPKEKKKHQQLKTAFYIGIDQRPELEVTRDLIIAEAKTRWHAQETKEIKDWEAFLKIRYGAVTKDDFSQFGKQAKDIYEALKTEQYLTAKGKINFAKFDYNTPTSFKPKTPLLQDKSSKIFRILKDATMTAEDVAIDQKDPDLLARIAQDQVEVHILPDEDKHWQAAISLANGFVGILDDSRLSALDDQLKTTNLYDTLVNDKGESWNRKLDLTTQYLVYATSSFRDKNFDQLKPAQQRLIIALNRSILGLTEPQKYRSNIYRHLFADRKLSYAKLRFAMRLKLADALVGNKDFAEAETELIRTTSEADWIRGKLKAKSHMLPAYKQFAAHAYTNRGDLYSYFWSKDKEHKDTINRSAISRRLGTKEQPFAGKNLTALLQAVFINPTAEDLQLRISPADLNKELDKLVKAKVVSQDQKEEFLDIVKEAQAQDIDKAKDMYRKALSIYDIKDPAKVNIDSLVKRLSALRNDDKNPTLSKNDLMVIVRAFLGLANVDNYHGTCTPDSYKLTKQYYETAKAVAGLLPKKSFDLKELLEKTYLDLGSLKTSCGNATGGRAEFHKADREHDQQPQTSDESQTAVNMQRTAVLPPTISLDSTLNCDTKEACESRTSIGFKFPIFSFVNSDTWKDFAYVGLTTHFDYRRDLDGSSEWSAVSPYLNLTLRSPWSNYWAPNITASLNYRLAEQPISHTSLYMESQINTRPTFSYAVNLSWLLLNLSWAHELNLNKADSPYNIDENDASVFDTYYGRAALNWGWFKNPWAQITTSGEYLRYNLFYRGKQRERQAASLVLDYNLDLAEIGKYFMKKARHGRLQLSVGAKLGIWEQEVQPDFSKIFGAATFNRYIISGETPFEFKFGLASNLGKAGRLSLGYTYALQRSRHNKNWYNYDGHSGVFSWEIPVFYLLEKAVSK